MPLGRLFARAALVGVIASVALMLMGPAAGAAAMEGSPADVCKEFPHKQTYRDDGFFRAPAWRYDGTVTIVYETETCTAEIAESGAYVLSLAGVATVYEGDKPEARPIDKRPFSSVIQADAKDDAIGWPIRWWNCFDGTFDYVWSIPDVYTFGVSAKNGRWLMYQREEPEGESSVTTVDACRKDDRRTV